MNDATAIGGDPGGTDVKVYPLDSMGLLSFSFLSLSLSLILLLL